MDPYSSHPFPSYAPIHRICPSQHQFRHKVVMGFPSLCGSQFVGALQPCPTHTTRRASMRKKLFLNAGTVNIIISSSAFHQSSLAFSLLGAPCLPRILRISTGPSTRRFNYGNNSNSIPSLVPAIALFIIPPGCAFNELVDGTMTSCQWHLLPSLPSV